MRGRNQLKIYALRTLEQSGPINPPAFSRLAGFRFESSAYHYLRRLAFFGLAERITRRGLLLYQISEKGRARLRYFEEKKRHA